MTDDRMYLGRPGNLAAIRSPRGTVQADRQRRVATFELGVGGYAVDQMIGGARTYTISYEYLLRTDAAVLQAYAEGHEGPGPFAFLDPGQRNMLPTNIAAATSVTNDAATTRPVGGFELTGAQDTFGRTESSAWGDADTEQTWTVEGTASQYSVSGGVGVHAVAALNTTLRSRLTTVSYTDVQVTATTLTAAAASGNYIRSEIILRMTDVNNFYALRVHRTTSNTVDLQLIKILAGVETVLESATSATVHVPGTALHLAFRADGTALSGWIWNDGATEPATAEITIADASHTAGHVGVATLLPPGNTNVLPFSVTYDDFAVTPLDMALSSSTAYTDAGPRVLAWTFTGVSDGDLVFDWPSSVFRHGVPVVAGRPLCLSCYVRGGGTDAVVTYTPSLVWRDATGTPVGSDAGTPVASASGAWARMYAAAVPPAAAVYADVRIRYTSGAAAGSIGYFRRFQLEEGSTPGDWFPGTGVWPVRFGALPDAWPFLSPELRSSPIVTLIEDVS